MSYRANKLFALSRNGDKSENPILWPWPMTSKFSRFRAVVKKHIRAKFHRYLAYREKNITVRRYRTDTKNNSNICR